ncbi:MAG TPA: EAL domain-containing protein [Candidatus Limnocylindria bacterium]|nr:EAL domain-containing protein [Candidatus Limnocylindria bacterium]
MARLLERLLRPAGQPAIHIQPSTNVAEMRSALAANPQIDLAVIDAAVLGRNDGAALGDLLDSSDIALVLCGAPEVIRACGPVKAQRTEALLRLPLPAGRAELRQIGAVLAARWRLRLETAALDQALAESHEACKALETELRFHANALRQCEGDLEIQRRRFDTALDSMPHGMCMWDSDLTLIACNQRYREMFDLPGSTTRPGAHLLEMMRNNVPVEKFPEETPEETYEAFVKLIAECPSSKVFRKFKGGRVVAIATNQIAGGGYVTIYADATETNRQFKQLRQREEDLRIQNLRFDVALNTMTHGLSMYDADGRLIVCNRRYAELYRLPPELCESGTPLRTIVEYCYRTGVYGPAQENSDLEDRIARIVDGQPFSEIREMLDGTILAIEHCPMEDGGWVATHQDITEQKRNEARIRHMARHDDLTGLPNRVLLHERMQDALARVRRGDVLAVLCLDLDNFKNVNDTLGHPIGDALLRVVGERLIATVRETDTVARLGGDEFAIVQAAVARPEDAEILARRLVEAISEPYDLDGHQVMVGVSIGIALAPADGTDVDDLMKNADMALYRAKTEGRGIYRVFEPEMDAQLQTRRVMELDLRRALLNQEFTLHYQPLVNLETQRITGFEALLRWQHPEHGLVPPLDFIPLAEEIGIIIPLGEWVLREACREATTWPKDVIVAVNLSPMQFRSRNLTHDVIGALASSGLEPNRLELEITESVLLIESEATLDTLHQLRSLGVRIAMDDFGTGYSSLSYLRSFPFDKIKIDGSFVRDSSTRADCAAIVRAVAGLGMSLGIPTTAEGVETEEQLRHVFDEGCTEMQGYLFSRPLPARELHVLLQRLESAEDAA